MAQQASIERSSKDKLTIIVSFSELFKEPESHQFPNIADPSEQREHNQWGGDGSDLSGTCSRLPAHSKLMNILRNQD